MKKGVVIIALFVIALCCIGFGISLGVFITTSQYASTFPQTEILVTTLDDDYRTMYAHWRGQNREAIRFNDSVDGRDHILNIFNDIWYETKEGRVINQGLVESMSRMYKKLIEEGRASLLAKHPELINNPLFAGFKNRFNDLKSTSPKT